MYEFLTEQVDEYESTTCYVSMRQICMTNDLLFNALMIIILRPCFSLNQGFPTCGTRTTGGTRNLFWWYARYFPKIQKEFVFTES